MASQETSLNGVDEPSSVEESIVPLPADLTHWREFDFRLSWVTVGGLERALRRVEAEHADDGLDMAEHAEAILGLAYVSLQIYIGGSVADLRAAFGDLCAPAAELRAETHEPDGTLPSPIETLWAAGNYAKHRDEWSRDWKGDKRNAPTVDALARIGIGPTTEFPCLELLQRLGSPDVVRLGCVVSAWRERWLGRLRASRAANGAGPSRTR